MTASDLRSKDWSRAARRALTPTEVVGRLVATPGWRLSGDGADVAIEKT
ncbi:MAG: 4a-hydroxytetrahydrobiopterin dehydratase, partial [Ramlibacter sp.]